MPGYDSMSNRELLLTVIGILRHERRGLRAISKDQDAMAEQQEHQHELLHNLIERMQDIMATVQDVLAQSQALLDKVTMMDNSMDAMKVYVQGLKDQMTQISADLQAALANQDPAALQQAADNLNAAVEHIDTANVEAAAIMNTPEAPPAETPPATPPTETPPAQTPPDQTNTPAGTEPIT